MKAIISIFSLIVFLFVAVSTSYAVKPPSVAQRRKASSKYIAHKAAGCRYGRDPVTHGCYKPKEGQLYRDPKTGKLKMKKIKKWNVPWKE